MAGQMAGRIALVTGAARGQGEATARLFAREGAKVIVADVDAAEGQAVAASIGPEARFARLDITDEANWKSVADEAQTGWGVVDVLVNNAGIVFSSSILTLEKSDFQRVLDINLVGAWLGIKTLAPGMIANGKGAIVNIVSTAGLWGMNGVTAYAASKWALRGLTKTAAMELGPKGVRVNAVFPGGVNTRMGNITNEAVEELNKYYQGQPIKRIGEPEEIATCSLFLASDAASYLCGAEVVADGGMSLGVFNDFLPTA